MQQVKILMDTLQEKVTAQVEAEIAKAGDAAQALKDRMCGMAEFTGLTLEQQEQIIRPFTEFTQSMERQKLIAVIRDTLRRFEETDYPKLLVKLSEPQMAPDEHVSSVTGLTDHTKKDFVSEKPRASVVKMKNLKSIPIPFNKAWLADESDVEHYLDSMRKALFAEIRSGKRIQI